MSEMERNLTLTRHVYASWSESKGNERSTLLDLMTDDVHWGALPNGAPGAEFVVDTVGKDGVGQYLAALAAEWTMDFYEIDELIADRDRVIALARCGWTNRATGKSVRTPKCDVFRFRDGKIAEFRAYYDTASVRSAATHDDDTD